MNLTEREISLITRSLRVAERQMTINMENFKENKNLIEILQKDKEEVKELALKLSKTKK